MNNHPFSRCYRSLVAALAIFLLLTAPVAMAVTPRIAAGSAHTVSLKPDGSLWAWGRNLYGQIGDGTSGISAFSKVPKQIGTGYTAIAAGGEHTVAIKSDGSLWAWGWNKYGQLGDGTTTNSLVPKQIGTGYTTIAAGYSHTVAIKSDGSLWAWGHNDSGQLGDGTYNDGLAPKKIGDGYSAVAAGGGYDVDSHTVAIKSDGTLWAWGANTWGQLGDGTSYYRSAPRQISGMGYTAIAAGGQHTVALKTDGSLWAWGWNLYGQLGDGLYSICSMDGTCSTLGNSEVPKQIGTGYSAIAAGYAHTVALKSDGSLWAWGWDWYDQLGDNITTGQPPEFDPVPRQIDTGYMAIAAGEGHTVALKSNGSLWGWGNSAEGQVGNNTFGGWIWVRAQIDTGYTATAVAGLNPAQLGGPDDNPHTVTEGGSMGCNSCPCQGLPNYSVDTAQLNLTVQDTDFAYKGLGPGVSIRRTYNLDPSRKGLFGTSWSSTFETRITASGGLTGTVSLTKGSGQTLSYVYASSATANGIQAAAYTRPSGIFDTLSGYSNGTVTYYLLKEKQTRYTYRYDADPTLAASFRLSSITDRNGNALSVAYNTDGTISAVTDAAGRSTTFSYNADKRCIKATTPDGAFATYNYDANGNMTGNVDLLGTSIAYAYDAGNFMTGMTVGGKTIAFAYDTSGGWKRVAKVTDADGYIRQYTGIAGGSTTSTDARQNKNTYASANGKTTGKTNALGKTWSTTYLNGLPATKTDPAGNIAAMGYDANGNLTKYTDAAGGISTFAYDADSNLLSMTTPLQETWTYAYDAKGNLISISSPGGKKSTMNYDGKGNLISTTDPNLNTTTFTYYPLKYYNLASITDSLGKVTSFGYDQIGVNATSVTDPNNFTTTFAYDKNRRLTKATYPDGSSKAYGFDATAMISTTDEIGNKNLLTRDARLNIVKVTDPLLREYSNTYDGNGNLLSITDPLRHTQSFTYDGADRLTKMTDPLNNSINIVLDGNGNTTAVSDEKNKQTGFAYTPLNLLSSITDPLGKKVSKTYDALGRISQFTTARGATVGLSYNSDGWLTGKSYGGASVATYGYDNAGNLIATTDSGGTTAYAYDAANRIAGITYADGKALTQTYDNNRNLKTLTYPGGVLVTYTYDNRNRVQKVAWGGGSIDFTYDAAGNLLKETRSNTTLSTYAYDAARQLISLSHKKGSTVIADLAYTRNAAGLVTGETGTFPLLVPAMTSSNINGTYNDANSVTTWDGGNYTYDADGNLTTITGAKTFSAAYDNQNRPTSMTVGGITTTYTYGALGNRVKAQSGTATRNFHYDPWGRLLFETDSSGQVTVNYIYAGGRLVASGTSASGFVFYHQDKTGNTLALTDSNGTVVGAFAYSPYGAVLGSSGSVTTPFKYVGAYGVMDEGGGIYFMKNRYYDANTGRFLQKDPIGIAGGQTNLYAYVGGSPVESIDPEGLDGHSIIVFWIRQGFEVIGNKLVSKTIDTSAVDYIALRSSKLAAHLYATTGSSTLVETAEAVAISPIRLAVGGVLAAWTVTGGALWAAGVCSGSPDLEAAGGTMVATTMKPLESASYAAGYYWKTIKGAANSTASNAYYFGVGLKERVFGSTQQ